MGLDMYFNLRTRDTNTGEPESVLIDYPDDLKKDGKIKSFTFPYVDTETTYCVGYFRKFNALHKWIVKYCADGRDECQDIYLDREKIKELKNILFVLATTRSEEKAAELLPAGSGFFFGSTEYDKWYFEDCARALEMFEWIEKILDETRIKKTHDEGETYEWDKYKVVYEASW